MTGLAVAAVACAVVLVVVAIGLQVVESRRRRRTTAATQAEVDALRARIAELEAARTPEPRQARGRSDEVETQREFVITSIGAERERPDQRAEVQRVDLSAPAFADAVLRESVLHTASFVHGVRRALSPEVRNRIRFEIRREIKRSRKERKVEVREALREYRARHRAEVDGIRPVPTEEAS